MKVSRSTCLKDARGWFRDARGRFLVGHTKKKGGRGRRQRKRKRKRVGKRSGKRSRKRNGKRTGKRKKRQSTRRRGRAANHKCVIDRGLILDVRRKLKGKR